MHIIQYLKQLQKKLTAKLRFEALKGILTHVPLERIFNQKNFCETEFQKKSMPYLHVSSTYRDCCFNIGLQ